ncbi:cupredoxin domain-containing protein [Mangrovibrevibacter kandeliae]|uniref:hypothetical protein n=1 Tax=Mangrovibrevibacter kandeliae TaxID=2968473 RepID=UPI002118541B|nr:MULTISPECIES: hypothetical protein [unclassified Aurantimonas]MCQ8783696.1 hypothetical protein [Aurantimonas sp. CSK15Z-1]MCW4116341.1 hypothetical protein [Aurantimonas sp. MSK8Z-1]
MKTALLLVAAAGTGFLLTCGAAAVAPSMVIEQRDRSFDRAAAEIHRGDTIRFTNDDPFLHQIYVESPEFSFDSDGQAPQQNVDIAFTKAGTFEVRCGIHPRMRLDVTVDE